MMGLLNEQVAEVATLARRPDAPHEDMAKVERWVAGIMVDFGLDPADKEHRLGVFTGLMLGQRVSSERLFMLACMVAARGAA